MPSFLIILLCINLCALITLMVLKKKIDARLAQSRQDLSRETIRFITALRGAKTSGDYLLTIWEEAHQKLMQAPSPNKVQAQLNQQFNPDDPLHGESHKKLSQILTQIAIKRQAHLLRVQEHVEELKSNLPSITQLLADCAVAKEPHRLICGPTPCLLNFSISYNAVIQSYKDLSMQNNMLCFNAEKIAAGINEGLVDWIKNYYLPPLEEQKS